LIGSQYLPDVSGVIETEPLIDVGAFEDLAARVGNHVNPLDLRPNVVFVGIGLVKEPDRAADSLNAQIAFERGPSLLQIVVSLIVQVRSQRLPE
jgi:hypothetical protein